MPEPLLDELAQDAPLPPPGFVDAVISAGRRRARRARAVVGGAVGVVAIALAVPVAIQVGRGGATPSPGSTVSSRPAGVDRTTPRPRPSTSVPMTSTAPTPASTLMPQTGPAAAWSVYATVVQRVDADSGAGVRGIDVRDLVCANADQPTARCTGGTPLTSMAQQYILDRIDAEHPIRFRAAPTTTPPGSSGRGGQTLFLTFGPAQLVGSRATVFLQTWCGFNCVRGDRYVLAHTAGRWQVTGIFGTYIS